MTVKATAAFLTLPLLLASAAISLRTHFTRLQHASPVTHACECIGWRQMESDLRRQEAAGSAAAASSALSLAARKGQRQQAEQQRALLTCSAVTEKCSMLVTFIRAAVISRAATDVPLRCELQRAEGADRAMHCCQLMRAEAVLS